ncbi:MAG TPA: sigma-54-dependent Fis family transcriptional regulator [Syntrophaceae bacterium]|jgi:two-component system response regulator FlrC|nr:sigma-54-dependent Fis family transcriptional regulator [Syntrophaceae bacterium]
MNMNKKPVLVVDDDPSMRMALSESLLSCGYEVDNAVDGADALRKISKGKYDLVITDMRMPKVGGMEVLRGVKKISSETHVIVITAYGTVNTAVSAMKEGASDFIMKPFSLEDLESVVKNVFSSNGEGRGEKKVEGEMPSSFKEIVTCDKKMISLLELLKCVSKSKSSVLIQGESGTGKELFARYIHRHSNRSHMPFIAVNCAAVPHTLLESEMFGYEKGAFTGALQKRPGKFELADGGTLLLDEISEMDIQLQAKLLRAIQEGEIDRLGGRETIPVDVRIIATTNSDLKKDISEKKFREDLYYRLNVIPVHIPPLRNRMSDILLLGDYFLKKYSGITGRKCPVVSEGAMSLLKNHAWPGNVREFENIIERAVLIVNGGEIREEHLHLEVGEKEDLEAASSDISFKGSTLWEVEKNLIFETLKEVDGNKTKASKILGISVRTMRNKLNEYKMTDL